MSASLHLGVLQSKPSIAPYWPRNFGSPSRIGGASEAWIQAPSPIASAVSIMFCSSRSASICVRIDQMVPSGSLMSLFRNPYLIHFFTPAGW